MSSIEFYDEQKAYFKKHICLLDLFDSNYYRAIFKVHPKVCKSVHYCPATGKTLERTYTDLTSLDAYPSSAAYPTQVR